MPEEPKKINYNTLGFVPLEEDVQSPIVKAMRVLKTIFDGPISWFRGIVNTYSLFIFYYLMCIHSSKYCGKIQRRTISVLS